MATSNAEASISANQRPRRWGLTLWLHLSQLATLAALFPWFVVAATSFMAFESGVTSEAVTHVFLMWRFPVLALLCVIVAWRSYNYRIDELAAVLDICKRLKKRESGK
jgi:hypothetical protein